MSDDVRRADQPQTVHPTSPGLVERGAILFAKAMVALAYVSVAYGILVASFFLCCGIDGLTLVNPAKSPFGAAITVLVVWPVGGFVCLLLDGGLGDLLDGVERGGKWVVGRIRSAKSSTGD
jgi:hypothetical protein